MEAVVSKKIALIRLKDVLARVRIGRSTIYSLIKASQFPKPISLGPRSVAWIEAEIDEWIAQKVACR